MTRDLLIDDDNEVWEPEPVEIPIDGELDLHTFSPKEIKDLVPDYLDACREKGILHVRIVHGKGKGVLRKTVLAILQKLPHIREVEAGGHDSGAWGATLVTLEPISESSDKTR